MMASIADQRVITASHGYFLMSFLRRQSDGLYTVIPSKFSMLYIFFLFGGKKIPEFFKGLGDAVKEFKKSSKDDKPEKEE